MNRLILTSTGFKNKKFAQMFIDSTGVSVDEIKVLFIPTAAISKEQKEIVVSCRNEIIENGIKAENVITYDLDREIRDEIKKYQAIYICGGDTKYLLDKINEVKFYLALKDFIENNGVVLGVSAGSLIFAGNLQNNLGYVNCILNVHRESGNENGKVDIHNYATINLTDNQALVVSDSGFEVVE